MGNVDVTEGSGNAARNASIPVTGNTRRRVMEVVERINKKERGRKVRPDEVIASLLDLLTPEREEKIQLATYSPLDLMEMGHAEYVEEHGPIPYEVFMVKVVNGAIPKPKHWPDDMK